VPTLPHQLETASLRALMICTPQLLPITMLENAHPSMCNSDRSVHGRCRIAGSEMRRLKRQTCVCIAGFFLSAIRRVRPEGIALPHLLPHFFICHKACQARRISSSPPPPPTGGGIFLRTPWPDMKNDSVTRSTPSIKIELTVGCGP